MYKNVVQWVDITVSRDYLKNRDIKIEQKKGSEIPKLFNNLLIFICVWYEILTYIICLTVYDESWINIFINDSCDDVCFCFEKWLQHFLLFFCFFFVLWFFFFVVVGVVKIYYFHNKERVLNDIIYDQYKILP